jgi:integrase
VVRAEVQPLAPVEVKKLLGVIQEDRLAALYTVALAVGLRQGEALGLRWQDVNLEAGTLSVVTSLQRLEGQPVLAEPKTDKSRRTIKLPDVCIAALQAHREKQTLERAFMGEEWKDEWNLVFVEDDGSPLSRYAVTRRFQRILADSGIPKRRFHDLRHTCATLLLAQGVPLRVVQETLGHSLFSTTADIYSHVLPVLMADAAAKMDAALA